MVVCVKSNFNRLLYVFILLALSQELIALDVIVKGLTKNSAVIEVNGQQRLLRVGKTSPEGITLLAADSKKAEIEYEGKKKTLYLNKRIGAQYAAPEVNEVRLLSTHGDHFIGSGRINNRSASFMVDTGATNVAMNSKVAKSLGIDYLKGDVTAVSTANGVVKAYNISLKNVTVGSISLNNVKASVMEGDFPEIILLGNSFLSRLEYRVEGNMMLLKQKF